MGIGESLQCSDRDRNWYENQFDLDIDIVKLVSSIISRKYRLIERLQKAEKSYTPKDGYLFSIRFARPTTYVEIDCLETDMGTNLEVGKFGASHGLPRFTSGLIEIEQPMPDQNQGLDYTRVYAYSPDRRYRLTLNEECSIRSVLVEDGYIDAFNSHLEAEFSEKYQEDDDDIPF